ncbi:3'(2'),5'-bisphosphate nucleotidase CysQ [Enemella sp. A6]|uniref:3'(2'),5'-bisphosphate nucleotidase CysQ n=1 Tax=Enemella sp. A6 TaxID=3440152 RepID=UPI003EB8FADC
MSTDAATHNGHGDDARTAAELATASGDLLLKIREDLRSGAEPSDVRNRGDRESDDLLHELLGERCPGDSILSEETADSPQRLEADRVWIIDPLDGTREFGEDGRSDWAVHVALVSGGELVAGAVALPALGITFSSDRVETAPRPDGPVRVVVSRTRRPEPVLKLAEAMDAELVEMGSAGAKAMAVVRGEVDIYAHTGGQYEWDSAAPVAVAQAAGLHVSRIDGSPLRYNQPDPKLPDLLICRPEYAARALEVLNS